MAVELTKIALWLEAYTPDAPLGFIDHHIRCGDALLGVLDPAILENGIPDKAFNALSGDDKEVVKALKKANKDAQKSIAKIQREGHMPNWQEAVAQSAVLETLPDDTLAAVEAKRAAFTETEAAVSQSRARIAADLFVAAFVLPKTPQNKDFIATSQDLWLVMNGEAPRAGVREAAAQAAVSGLALHWWQVFPQVQVKGGFDVLLGNPPWERIKLQEEEFFASRSEQIATAPHKAERGRLILELAEAKPGSPERRLYDDFIAARRQAEAASLFAHDAGRYPLTGVGDVNTYALFSETFAQLMAVEGRAGFIVPTGIATDDSTKAYFEEVSQNGRLASLKGFWEIRRIFPATDSRDPFCLLTLGGSQSAEFIFQAKTVADVSDDRRRFTLTPQDFRLINPNTRTCPVFRSQQDAELTKKLYRAAPVLIKEGPPEQNPWGIQFMRMLDMANDSGLFRDTPGLGRLPLYEAKMIHQFDHRWATYDADDSTRDVTILEKRDSSFVVTPHRWVDASEIENRLINSGWKRPWLLGWRRNTRVTDERTCIAGVIPATAVGDSIFLMLPRNSSGQKAGALYANLNALAFDFIVRQKLGGVNFSYYIIKQLPVLPPDRYTDADLAFIVPRVLELTYTAHDLKPWAEDLGYDGPPFAFAPERRAVLRAELDACYARLYGLSRDELRYVLDPADVMSADYPSESFRVLKNNEMRAFGEYRTGRLVLRELDRMALADASGETYQSLLVPPPGQQPSPQYSSIGVIRDENEARLAGLVLALIRQAGTLPRQHLNFALAALQNEMPATVSAPQAAVAQLSTYRQSHTAMLSDQPERLQSMLRFFEVSGAIRIQQQGTLIESIADAPLPNGVIVESDADAIAGILLRIARASLEQQEAEAPSTASQPATKQA